MLPPHEHIRNEVIETIETTVEQFSATYHYRTRCDLEPYRDLHGDITC